MLYNVKQNARELLVTQYDSILVDSDASVYTAIVLKGVMRLSESGRQDFLSEGWLPGAAVNRLQMCNNTLYACTDKGLLVYRGQKWNVTDIDVPCYQIQESGGMGFAATESGLWCGSGCEWRRSAFADKIVYDVICLPGFLIMGLSEGIFFCRRDTFAWGKLCTGHSITSIAIFHNQLVATTGQGCLIVGTSRDHFEVLRIERTHASHLISKGGHVFLCSDQGLFRLEFIDSEIQLLVLKNDCLVADVDVFHNKLYMATYFSGIQTLEM